MSPSVLTPDSTAPAILSAEGLEARFESALAEARNNPYLGFPNWINDVDPATLYRSPIIVCGSQWYAKVFLQYARQAGLNILGVVDDRRPGQTSVDYGIISTADMIQLANQNPNCLAINLADPHYGLQHFGKVARDNNIRLINYFQALRLPGFSEAATGQNDSYFNHILENEASYRAIGKALGDEYSRLTYYAILLFRLTQDRRYVLQVNRPYEAQYFYSGLFELGGNESFVDAGAYQGDTAETFLQAVGGEFKHIYSFEPDSKNYALLEAYKTKLQGTGLGDKLSTYKAGLWNESKTLYFNASGNYGSHILFQHLDSSEDIVATENNSAYVPVDVVSLDETIQDDVSFIKMDIEGSEFPAVQGARRLITEYKPKLAIAVYHLPTDLVNIVEYIQNLDLGYKLGLRHHNYNLWDSVFYAY